MGGRQTITGDQIEFVGYGLQIPAASIDDYARTNAKGKIVVWLGANGPGTVGPESRRLLTARSRLAVEKGAAAVFAPAAGRGQPPAGAAGARGVARPRPPTSPRSSATTSRRRRRSPRRTSSSSSCSAAPEMTYAALKEAAAKREPIAPFTLKNVKIADQRRRRLHRRQHPAHPQRRRHRRRQRRAAQGHLRAVRRALRPRRLLAGDARAGRGGAAGGAAGGCTGQIARHAPAGRRHQQRRGRRWVRDGGGDGGGASVRARAEAEAVGDVRVALGRGVGALRLALHGRLPGGAARQGGGAVEHRHDRPQPLRPGVRGQHRLPGGVRPHQHRAAQLERGHQQGAGERRSSWITSSTIRPTRSRSTRAAITTAMRRRASRSSSTRPGCTRTITT